MADTHKTTTEKKTYIMYDNVFKRIPEVKKQNKIKT